MRRWFRFLPFVAVLAASCPAQAYVLQVLPPGTMFPPSQFAPVATFDGITQTPYGLTTATAPFSDGGAAFSGSGVVMNNGGGD
jgi:hypothetical protein